MAADEKPRLGILISGRGSNMVSLVEASRSGRLGAEVAVVVSNRADAPGLAKAAELGVPAECVPDGAYDSREAFEDALLAVLRRHRVEWIALAGFMRILTPHFLKHYPMRVVNIHPALLPAFKGLHAQRQALQHGVKITGCTVHFVDEEVDAGPIIAQSAVPVFDDDTEETLAGRILEQEHRLYPMALQAVLSGKVTVKGRRVLGIGGLPQC